MTRTDDVIARAFELARSGDCKTINEIRRKLEREGYIAVTEHFGSQSLKRQLVKLMKVSDG
jgi:hypothetical protein